MTQANSKRGISNRQRIAVLFGLVVSAVFLALAFQGLQPQAVLDSLDNLNVPLLLLATLTFFPSMLAIAWRWQFLLDVVGHVRLWALNEIVAVGYMGNNVYPLRAGEALRVYLLKRNHNLPVTPSLTTIIVERVFDGIVMLSFIVLGLQLADVPSEEVRTVAAVATPIFAVGVVVFFGLAAVPQLFRAIVARITGFLPDLIAEKIVALSDDVLSVFEGLRSPVQLFGTVFASYLTWAIQGVIYWLVLLAFGLDLGFGVALLVVGTVNLAGLIPASPGQIGVYEFFASTILIAVGVSQDRALAYALVVHVIIWLPVTVYGFVLLARLGLNWQSIARAQELEAQAAGQS